MSICPICDKNVTFNEPKSYWGFRDGYVSLDCQLGKCVTRERAVANVLFNRISRNEIGYKIICESSPCFRGLSLLLKNTSSNYVPTGYFPDQSPGTIVNGIRNENLEKLTFEDCSIDIWLHLDVLEHLYNPFVALSEIYRTLKPGGFCIFTAPTYPERQVSEQVAWLEQDGVINIVGDPEYHGNPQNPELGSLVTWRYGYDLANLIEDKTGFNVEIVRYSMRNSGIRGPMTEVYLCMK